MSGGAYDAVMGVFSNSSDNLWSGNSSSGNSGFTGKVGESGDDYTGVSFPNPKYYDVYKASSGTTLTNNKACNGDKCYGHGVSPEVDGWYSDSAGLVSSAYPWYLRSCYYANSSAAGLLFRTGCNGNTNSSYSFRLVLSEP